MVERHRSPDSDERTSDSSDQNTVFVDTSFDTHLAVISSDSDTVFNLKNKIVLEHGLCFPEIGLIKISALKVKRKGSFYHLPDYMFVKSVFKGVKNDWFLYVDVTKCTDVSQIVKRGASNQRALLFTNMHDQDHLRDDCFKIPCAVKIMELADVQDRSSSKPECNIPASSQEFKDDNVQNDVGNIGCYSSSQSVETCNSAKKPERKHNSFLATSDSKDNKMSPQASHSKQLLGSFVESETQRDGQQTDSSNEKQLKPNRKGSLHLHEQAHSSLSLEKCVEVNECIKQNPEFEKSCSSSGKYYMAAPASICSPGIPNSSNNDMQKTDHMDTTVETNLLSLHDPEVNHTGEPNPSQDGPEKAGESTLPSALSDTKEMNVHGKRSKKKAKSSKSKFLDGHVDQARNLMADSRLVLPDINVQELPESDKSKKGKLFSGKHDVTELGVGHSLDIHHSLHDDMLKVDNINNTEERMLFAVHDPEIRQTEELDLLHYKSTVPSALLVTKEVKKHKSSRKKRSKISRSGVQDEHVDRSMDSTADVGLLLPIVASSDNQFCESVIEKGICSTKVDAKAVEQNIVKKIVDNDEATEGVKRGGKKKEKKVKRSGAAVKDQQNRESVVAENNLNLNQVLETELSTNSECPGVLEAFEVNEATEDEKAIGGNEKKQKVEKAVARDQETLDMNRDADQITAIVSPSLDRLDPGKDVSRDCKKKKKKVKRSGAASKDQQNRESVVAESDLNLKRASKTELPSKSECPDVPKATEEENAIGEKKQMVENAVARVQETVDMNRDVDQINDNFSPSLASPELASPDPGALVCPSQNDEIYQKIEDTNLLVNKNLEELVLSRDVPSYRDQSEPVIETVSNTNTSTTVADKQKMSGTKRKRRATKTISGVCRDGMDTENTQTSTGPSSSEPNRHADLQVEKDKDLLPVPKGIEASARKSYTSRGKNISQMDSPLNQVPVELKSQKDGEVSEPIGKEINFKQYFVSSHHQDEVTREPSAGTVADKKREDVVPTTVSAPKLQQDFPKSSKKDSIISSAGKANTLTESNRVTKTKKKVGKRGVPYAAVSSDHDEIRTPQKSVSSAFLNGSDATKTVPRKKETVKSVAAAGINSSSKTFEKLPLKSNTLDRKESSLRHNITAGKNISSKLDGKVVNKSKQEKSLKQTPKPIFRDSSSESSLDENGSVDSTASTRTPSDNLSSSSDLSEDAMSNGRDNIDNGGTQKSVFNSENSDPRQITLDAILKSSSRFKKAKLTASQQFADPDFQPGDLFPETQLFP